jgi:NAD(P)-dependent dehydrogenase (short-subunit alcohol dehydrogenase family)
MTIRFDNKVVIVTGAGGGLGRAHALEFARRGAKVVVNDLGGAVDGTGGSSRAAEAVVDEITSAGGAAIANGASVTDDEGVSHLVKQTMDAFGRIDILVANAGTLRDKSLSKMTLEDFEAVLAVHVMGTVKPTRAIWPIMCSQHYGRIVVTSSASGLYGNFGQTNYGTAKLGLIGFMNSLKLEGARENIKVNAICPGAATRMTDKLLPPDILARLKPEYVTPAVIFLASDDAPSGAIVSASAGIFSCVQLVESIGLNIGPDANAEDIAAGWTRMCDFTDAMHFNSAGESGAHIFERLKGGA